MFPSTPRARCPARPAPAARRSPPWASRARWARRSCCPRPAATTWWSSASVNPAAPPRPRSAPPPRPWPGPSPSVRSVATALIQATEVAPAEAAQAIAEGMTMAAYRYVELKSDKTGVPALANVVLLTDPARAKAVADGAERGRVIGEAVCFARDLVERAARPPHRPPAGRGGPPRGREQRPEGGGARRGRHRRAAPRRPLGREPGLGRAAAPREADLRAAHRPCHAGARRQGDHLRLRRHLPEAERRHACRHEDGHVRRGRRAGHHVAPPCR